VLSALVSTEISAQIRKWQKSKSGKVSHKVSAQKWRRTEKGKAAQRKSDQSDKKIIYRQTKVVKLRTRLRARYRILILMNF
jgi:hypothetical protein